MQRVRRLGSLVLALALGAGALTGCRSAPTVAAYVGSREFSQHYVDRVTSEVDRAIRSMPADSRATIDLGSLRQSVVSTVVMGEVARRLARERAIPVPAPDMSSVTDSLGIPRGSALEQVILGTEFAKLIAGTDVAMAALLAATPAADPSEADQREVHRSFRFQGEPFAPPFDEIRRFLSKDAIGHQIALRTWLQQGVTQYRVTVNPKYAPVAWRVGVSFSSALVGYVAVPLVTR